MKENCSEDLFSYMEEVNKAEKEIEEKLEDDILNRALSKAFRVKELKN